MVLIGKFRKCQKVAPCDLWKRLTVFYMKSYFLVILEQLVSSLNIAVEMHPNGPKCLGNEKILSLLGLGTPWVLKDMVWSQFFAVLSLFFAAEVA